MGVNNFNPPQPVDVKAKERVAQGAYGFEKHGAPSDRPRSPRFHSLRITAAQNGVSVTHEPVHKPIRPGRDDRPQSPHMGEPQQPTEHVFGHGHPVHDHIDAIMDHISKGLRGDGDSDQ